MTEFRNWPRELRRASYKGTRFYVERDGVETGRRLVVHEFPHRDTPYVEDMGRDAYKMSVTAYVVGNQSDGEAQALRRACETKGAGPLSLPLDRFHAHCEKFQRDFSKDKLGLIAFSISFVRDGGLAGPFPVPALSHLVNLGINALLGPLRAAFGAVFAGLGVASFVSSAAVGIVRDIAATLQVAVSMPLVLIGEVPRLALAIADLHDDAASLVRVGALAARLDLRAFVAESDVVVVPEIVDRVWGIVKGIGDVTPAAAVLEIMAPLVEFAVEPGPTGTPSERQAAANAEALAGLVRVAALGAVAAAAVDMPLPDRRAAIDLRARVAEMFSAERERAFVAGNADLAVALDELAGRVVEQISRRVADLAPVLQVSADATMPALWWSHRIYGTADRAAEIARRNRVIHPGFMPREIEVLSR
jgi:hypothetical protein